MDSLISHPLAKSLSLGTWLTLCVLLGSRANAADFPHAEFRHWTTAQGVRSKVKLKATELAGNQVQLVREDGGAVRLPLSSLSSQDLAYLRELRKTTNASAGSPGTPPNATAAADNAADWPRWRGPLNDGISKETGLLKSWPEGGPPLLWTAGELGRGYSSISISDGRIYTMSSMGDGQTHLVALSTDGGKQLWSTPVSAGDAPNCTPTVDPASNMVFGISHQGVLLAADAKTGKPIWKRNFPEEMGGRMMSQWGYSESPLVDGDRLICTPGSDQAVLAAFNKRTGEPIWTTPMAGASAGYASPVISNAGGIKQYITLVGSGLIGVAADDGRLLWRYDRIANTTANVPTPIVHGDLVFGSSGYGDGGSALVRLHRQGKGIRVEELYYLKNNQLQNHHGGMIRMDDYVYMGHGHNKGFPVCFDLKKGQPVWGPERGPGSGSAAITAAEGKLYFRYEDATMALIDATPEGYRVRGEFRIKSRHDQSWPHPVISNKRLYLRDQHELHCYDIAE